MSPEELKHLMPYTKGFDLSEQQRAEVVTAVWYLMESIMDEALGIHPVQLSCEQLEPDHLQSHNHCSKIKKKSPINGFNKELSHDSKTTH